MKTAFENNYELVRNVRFKRSLKKSLYRADNAFKSLFIDIISLVALSIALIAAIAEAA